MGRMGVVGERGETPSAYCVKDTVAAVLLLRQRYSRSHVSALRQLGGSNGTEVQLAAFACAPPSVLTPAARNGSARPGAPNWTSRAVKPGGTSSTYSLPPCVVAHLANWDDVRELHRRALLSVERPLPLAEAIMVQKPLRARNERGCIHRHDRSSLGRRA